MDRCVGCVERDKSWAIANGCVGGDKYEHHRHITVYNTEPCRRACPCKGCCEGIQAAVADFQKMGEAYMAVRVRIMRAMEELNAGGHTDENTFRSAVNGLKQDPLAGKLSPKALGWEALGALKKVQRG
jgi:hypothetical protein